MNLFKAHSRQNEWNAKQALIAVAARTLSKYVICQEMMNSTLASGESGKCLYCTVDKLTKKMAKYEGQVGELAKTYEVMFDEKLDIAKLTKDALKEFYPLTVNGPQQPNWEGGRRKGGTVEGKDKPKWTDKPFAGDTAWAEKQFKEDYGTKMPQEVRDTINKIKESLAQNGNGDVEVRVMRVPRDSDGRTLGLDPNDFDSFEEFYDALKSKAEAEGIGEMFGSEEFRNAFENRKGEDIITESVIHDAEVAAATANAEATEDKKRASRGGNKGKGKNMPKNKGNKPELIN